MTRRHLAGLALTAAVAATGCGSVDAEPPRPAVDLPPFEEVGIASCSPLSYGGPGRPQLLVTMSSMLQGDYALSHGLPASNAVKLVFGRRGWKAGPHRVGLQVCDEIDARTGLSDQRTCARNARAYARNPVVVAVVGAYFSTCSLQMVAIANRAPEGPLGMVSGGNSYLGLTRSGPGTADDEPDRHYPTGRRNYARVAPPDDAQAAAAALRARDLGSERPFALHNGDPYGNGFATAFAQSAEGLGLSVAGLAPWNPRARGYAALARRLRAAGADAALLAGYHTDNGARLIRDLRRELGRDFPIVTSDGFGDAAPLVEGAGSLAEGVAIATGVLPPSALPPAGRRFVAEYEDRYGQRPCCYAVHFAQAAEVVLDAIARSDGTRAAVNAEIFRTQVRDGLLGDFTIDRYGDSSAQTVAAWEIRRGRMRFVTKITPPQELLARR